MKTGFVLALVVAVSGQVLYHITQKSVNPAANPVASLIVFYVAAALLSVPLFWLFPLTESIGQELAKMNWAVLGVAFAIVLIEIGFLLAYRAGANLSSAFVLTASVVTISLLIVGVTAFGEPISLTKVAGIGLCVGGIWLLTAQS